MDIIVFDVLPASDGNGEGHVSLAKEVKDNNPLRHYFRVSTVQVLYIIFRLSFLGAVCDCGICQFFSTFTLLILLVFFNWSIFIFTLALFLLKETLSLNTNKTL